MFKGLWNYAIKAKDIEQTLQYYLNCLDAELLVSSNLFGCKYHLVRVGDTRIIILIPCLAIRMSTGRCRSLLRPTMES